MKQANRSSSKFTSYETTVQPIKTSQDIQTSLFTLTTKNIGAQTSMTESKLSKLAETISSKSENTATLTVSKIHTTISSSNDIPTTEHKQISSQTKNTHLSTILTAATSQIYESALSKNPNLSIQNFQTSTLQMKMTTNRNQILLSLTTPRQNAQKSSEPYMITSTTYETLLSSKNKATSKLEYHTTKLSLSILKSTAIMPSTPIFLISATKLAIQKTTSLSTEYQFPSNTFDRQTKTSSKFTLKTSSYNFLSTLSTSNFQKSLTTAAFKSSDNIKSTVVHALATKLTTQMLTIIISSSATTSRHIKMQTTKMDTSATHLSSRTANLAYSVTSVKQNTSLQIISDNITNMNQATTVEDFKTKSSSQIIITSIKRQFPAITTLPLKPITSTDMTSKSQYETTDFKLSTATCKKYIATTFKPLTSKQCLILLKSEKLHVKCSRKTTRLGQTTVKHDLLYPSYTLTHENQFV